MKTLQTEYRVETKWSYEANWRWLPENQGLTRARANEVMKDNLQWPDMSSRIVETRTSAVATRYHRALSQSEQQTRDFNLRSMGISVPERKSA